MSVKAVREEELKVWGVSEVCKICKTGFKPGKKERGSCV